MIRKRKIVSSEDERYLSKLTIEMALQEFLRYQTANARSAVTVITYSRTMKKFAKWIQEYYGNLSEPVRFLNSSEVVDNYVIWLRTFKQLSDTTVCHYKRHLRVFLYWLMDKKYINEYRIVVKQPQEEVIETYSESELNKLLQKPKTKEFVDNRDWVIINLLLATGNRRSTVIGYRIKDVDFEEHFLILNRTKNKRGQRLPIDRKLEPILHKYIKIYRSDCNEEDPLFPTQFGGWLNPNALTHSISTYNRNRGVNKTSIHLYRHTFARLWIKNGGDSLQLQRMLGHSTLNMTEKYVRLFSDDLRKPIDQFSPLSHFVGSSQISIDRRIKERSKGRKVY